MGSFETPPEWSFVEIFDNVIANELPELSRWNPDTLLGADHFCRMFACTGQTNTSKNFALSGNLHWEHVLFI